MWSKLIITMAIGTAILTVETGTNIPNNWTLSNIKFRNESIPFVIVSGTFGIFGNTPKIVVINNFNKLSTELIINRKHLAFLFLFL